MTLLNVSTVMHHAAALSGQPVNDEEGIDRNTHSMLTAFFNARLQVIWRADLWPDLIRTELRQKTPLLFVRGAEYQAGWVILWRQDQRTYLTVQDFGSDANNEPDNPTICAPLPPPEGLADIDDERTYQAGDWVFDPYRNKPSYCFKNGSPGYAHSDLTRFYPLPDTYFPEFEYQSLRQSLIGDVMRVTDRDPNRNEDEEDIPYLLTHLGVRVHGDPGLAWMQLRLGAPPISGEPWNKSKAYVSTQQLSLLPVEVPQIYYEVSLVGNYYDVIDTTQAGESPDSNPEKFRRVEIPALFGVWLAFALAADWLRMDGQTDKAGDREASATLELTRLKDNLHRQQRQVTCLPVMSR